MTALAVLLALLVGIAGIFLALRGRRERIQRSQAEARQAALSREVEDARANMRRILQLPEGPFERDPIRLAHRLRQSTTISGDFYNLIPRADGTVGVYLVDVEGHGLRASQEAQDIYRALNRPAAEWGMLGAPQDQLAEADRILREDLASTQIEVTMNFTDIDPNSRRIRHANAGMPYPLLFRDGQSAPEILQAAGVYVGGGYAMYAVEPKQIEVMAGPGDVLVLLSDGVLEAADPHGRTFGQEGVTLAVLSAPDRQPEAIADRILEAAATHAGRTEPEDDQTVLVVQIGRPPEPSGSTRIFGVGVESNTITSTLVNGEEFASQLMRVLAAIREKVPPEAADAVTAATYEALQNAARYGSAPGETILLRLATVSAFSVVTITQPRPWKDWDLQFGDARRRFWQDLMKKVEATGTLSDLPEGRGCWVILSNTESVTFSSDGSTMRMTFLHWKVG
jgi:serine phosphatase RsbU (regulator of sigma subunit)